MSKSCHPLSLYKQLLLQLVNNYNIRTELRFLNRTEPNLFQSEFEFLKTELQLNQNKKNLFCTSLVKLLFFIGSNMCHWLCELFVVFQTPLLLLEATG